MLPLPLVRLEPPATSTSPSASRVVVWLTRGTFMLPVLLNPPEPARAGIAMHTASPRATKPNQGMSGLALNLLLTAREEIIASRMRLVFERADTIGKGLLIGFISRNRTELLFTLRRKSNTTVTFADHALEPEGGRRLHMWIERSRRRKGRCMPLPMNLRRDRPGRRSKPR